VIRRVGGRSFRPSLVLNASMKRIPLGAALLACVLGAAAPTASAKIVELGSSADVATPSCPGTPCFVVTRTTALQVRTSNVAYPTTAPADGRIVAFTLQLAQLTSKQIHFFNSTYGGTARVQVTVLHQKPKRFFVVTAQSPVLHIQPFFGTTAQFPLETSLPVKKGDVVALTVPTWAPVLAVNLPAPNGWRASRAKDCSDLLTQTAQTTLSATTQYKCLYQTARITYTATEITTPVPPKPPKTTTPPKKKPTTTK
jgi:hypothetical protein